MKYENLYSKWLYVPTVKQGEVQLHKYPFHTGLRVLVTDGYRYLEDIHCRTLVQAKDTFKAMVNKYRGGNK